MQMNGDLRDHSGHGFSGGIQFADNLDMFTEAVAIKNDAFAY